MIKNVLTTCIAVAPFAIALLFLKERALFSRSSLRFNYSTLDLVVAKIEDECNVDIKVNNNEVLACRFTGIFYGRNDAVEIVRSLASALDLEYEIVTPENYKLTGAGCGK